MKFTLLSVLCLALLSLPSGSFAAADTFDLVLAGGRVMDPASGLDAPRHVGIRGDKIAAISEAPLAGTTVINVTGLVVAPGFIDLHCHGMATPDLTLKARDGVTTALELERGAFPVDSWYSWMAGRSPVNYGATVSHRRVRIHTFRPDATMDHHDPLAALAAATPRARAPEVRTMEQAVRRGLEQGALGIGFGIEYTPGADTSELEALFRIAAARKVPAFVHTRASGLAGIEEVVRIAENTGAALHLFHVGSSGLHEVPQILAYLDARKAAGLDVTTEVYPYTAASTRIESAYFSDGWQERLRISYGDVIWAATGERLTPGSFSRYRQQGGWVIMNMMKDENVERALAHPGVIIGSDSMPYVDGRAHPRGAGTFARVLGVYVREKKLLPLMEALAKMTILPARRLEHVPTMRTKGRIAVGADADLTVFNPTTVIDRATFEAPAMPSAGIPHVIVNGVLVVHFGELVSGAMAGRPVRNPVTNAR